MTLHQKDFSHFTKQEMDAGLALHHLKTDDPSQLSDCFRAGAEWGVTCSCPAYGIIDPDYARVFTQARIVAWQYGYACVMHGSFTRDLDLLLVPWTAQATSNAEQLLKLIAVACELRFSPGEDDVYKSTVAFTDKPHGRRSCTLFFPGFYDRRWVDISVLPCR